MSETPDFSNLSGNGMLVIHVLGRRVSNDVQAQPRTAEPGVNFNSSLRLP